MTLIQLIWSGANLEVVVVLPDRHGHVPGVDDGDAQGLQDGVDDRVAPAPFHDDALRRDVRLQLVARVQTHVADRLQGPFSIK